MKKANRKGMGCTIAGWVYYCDVHDTHGNADSKDEAWHMAESHQRYFEIFPVKYEECDLSVIEVSPVGLAVTDDIEPTVAGEAMKGSLYVYLGDEAALIVQPTRRLDDYRLILGEAHPRGHDYGARKPDSFTARVDRRALEQLHRLLGEFLGQTDG